MRAPHVTARWHAVGNSRGVLNRRVRALLRLFMLSSVISPALLPSWACSHAGTGVDPEVHSLRFEGNKAMSDATLSAQLVTEATAWYPFAATKRLDIAALDQDMRRITAFYADRGYFDARIARRRIDKREDGAVDITVTVDEGPPTKIDRVAVGAGGRRRRRRRAALDEAGDRHVRDCGRAGRLRALRQHEGAGEVAVEGRRLCLCRRARRHGRRPRSPHGHHHLSPDARPPGPPAQRAAGGPRRSARAQALAPGHVDPGAEIRPGHPRHHAGAAL